MKRPLIVLLVASLLVVTLLPQRVVLAASSAGIGIHCVKLGDTLYGIAARYGVSVSSIQVMNGLRGSAIYVGQCLRIPAGQMPSGSGFGETGARCWSEVSRSWVPSGGQDPSGSGKTCYNGQWDTATGQALKGVDPNKVPLVVGVSTATIKALRKVNPAVSGGLAKVGGVDWELRYTHTESAQWVGSNGARVDATYAQTAWARQYGYSSRTQNSACTQGQCGGNGSSPHDAPWGYGCQNGKCK